MSKRFKRVETNGRYLVQVGRGDKGSYTTRYAFDIGEGQENRAIFHYRCINIGNGYKKRLVGFDGKVVLREFS